MLGHKSNCASLSKIGVSLALMIRNQPILISKFFKAPKNKTCIQIKKIKYDMKSGRSNCEIKHLKLTQDIKFVVYWSNFLSFEAKLSYFRTYLISALYSISQDKALNLDGVWHSNPNLDFYRVMAYISDLCL